MTGHQCRPLHVGGRILATCTQHWMQTPVGTALSTPAGAR